jgi:hypothetical protein
VGFAGCSECSPPGDATGAGLGCGCAGVVAGFGRGLVGVAAGFGGGVCPSCWAMTEGTPIKPSKSHKAKLAILNLLM